MFMKSKVKLDLFYMSQLKKLNSFLPKAKYTDL